ncbi:LysR family transcriptional regulator [Roseovarius sp. A46]|uniref:LysR substrate-binding domain-containing protein n=1 Tax=Roseovarius sp. A46 TaxID=2109331 RepID=UPI001010B825|nr:LysR substrate-binding domain-containing protein [Roseovarius sp. A46]RXV61674.1 LysR family transcriptional regulator [Roseovarius sp. A46]
MPLPRRSLPSIASLRALEALDRLGSATAAAAELSLTQSAVSRQLKTLEDFIGHPILTREGRGVRLTPEAADYAARVRGALEQIAQATMRLSVNAAGGTLSLAILPTFGMRWLVPRLPDFAHRHPEVTINLSTRLDKFNFASEPFDAALHFGKPDWPGTGTLRLRHEAMVEVATPEFLSRQRAVRGPRDLLRLPLLHIGTRPDAWADWFAAHGITGVPIGGTIHDQFATIMQMALHGMGVALLPDYLVEQELATGRLVAPCGGPVTMRGAYYLVWPERRAQDAALTAFRDWLAGQADDEDGLPR